MIVHIPVNIPGWIKIDTDESVVLHVEVAPDESVFRPGGHAFEENENGDDASRNLPHEEAERLVSGLSNDSFREIAHADLYT